MSISHLFAIVLQFLLLKLGKQESLIESPLDIKASVGEDAFFSWNSTKGAKLLSVNWGVRKGNVADPQFISVDRSKVNHNTELGPEYKGRLQFSGNLRKGHAWFIIKNLTLKDTNEYIARIGFDAATVLPSYVHLMVTPKNKTQPTSSYNEATTYTPDITTQPTSSYNETTTSTPNITTAKPRFTFDEATSYSPNTATPILGIEVQHLLTLVVVLAFWLVLIRISS